MSTLSPCRVSSGSENSWSWTLSEYLPNPNHPGWNARAKMRAEREAAFIAGMQLRKSIAQICRELQVSRSTYEKYRRTSDTFRRMVDTIKMSDLASAEAAVYGGDFITFRKVMFGFDTYWHQREIVRAIETAKPLEPVMVLVPPEFGKTTLLEDYSTYDISMDPNVRITYGSGATGFVRKVIRRIKARMTSPDRSPEFLARFGPFYVPGQEKLGKPWAADFFTVHRADHDERDYTFEGRGWQSEVQGTRTDKLRLDDLQSLKTLALSKKIVDRVRQDFFSRPGKDATITLTGTAVAVGDVWDEFEAQELVSKVVKLPAVSPEGESLCPEMWSKDELAAKRRLVGEQAWWRNYQQQPQAANDATFLVPIVDSCKDITRIIGQTEAAFKIAGLDPALVGGNALVVAGFIEGREANNESMARAPKLEVIDCEVKYHLGRVEAILARVDYMAAKHGFHALLVETNAYQRGLATDDRLLALGRQYGFSIYPHETGNNKNDDTLGIAAMPGGMIGGRITFPDGDEHSGAVMGALYQEMFNWRADLPTKRRKQDLLMALWFCWLEFLRRAPGLSHTGPSAFQTRGLPWKPTGWQTSKGFAVPPAA